MFTEINAQVREDPSRLEENTAAGVWRVLAGRIPDQDLERLWEAADYSARTGRG